MATCSFTGHRPESIGGYDLSNPLRVAIRGKLEKEILRLIKTQDVDVFISGGALGVDIDSYFIIDDLKKEGYKIKNILAIPFYSQSCKWMKEDIDDYNIAKKSADEIIYVDTLSDYKLAGVEVGSYHPVKMQKRNEYMVNFSDFVIAVWNGYPKGGTYNAIRYARVCDKTIIRIEPVLEPIVEVKDECLYCSKNEASDFEINLELYLENDEVKHLLQSAGLETYINNNKLMIYHYDGGYILQDFTQIEYCPKCGRKFK